jgi:hypothetical protein
MTIGESTTSFGGKPIQEYDPEEGLTNAETTACKITVDYDAGTEGHTGAKRFEKLVENPEVAKLTALSFGSWGETATGDDSASIVEALVKHADKLPALRALFIGDMTFEECEISWINQADVSALFDAFPNLEELRIRGGNGLALGTPKHANLKRLIIESGGLDASVIKQVTGAELPKLEHLELWLGDSGYGWEGTVKDVAPLLEERRFPKLKYLGLRNSEIADDIAKAAANAAAVGELAILDFSMGNLGNEVGEALAASEPVRKLKKLDLNHHYMGLETMAKLRELGIEVDMEDAEGEADEDDRYVEVSE